MRKKIKVESETKDESQTNKYKIINLIESIQAIPYFNAKGQKSFLNLRMQGKGGQTPPVLEEWQITEKMRKLEKKNFIKLEKI